MKTIKLIFAVLIVFLLLAPLVLIYLISSKEMKEYAPRPVPEFHETAFGAVSKAVRMDVEETVALSGVFISKTYGFMELALKEPELARWYIRESDEVREGDTIGMYKGDPITASLTGIVSEMNIYSREPYIKLLMIEPVELECRISEQELSALERAGDDLVTEDGEHVTILGSSLTRDENGMRTVWLSIDSEYCSLGQAVQGLKLFTGRKYLQALVLDANCLYKKDPGSNEWYARKVTEDGLFIEELRVGVGYSAGSIVCVTGVNEGDCFDSGYGALIGSN